MAGLKDDAQWIVLMGFIVSFSLFFIAILLNQSTVVGQTTAEAVMEFPKNELRGIKDVVIQSQYWDADLSNKTRVEKEIQVLALNRQNTVVQFSSRPPVVGDPHYYVTIHYNNGVMSYNETWTSP